MVKKIDKELLLSFLLDHLKQLDNFVFLWNGKIDEDNYQSFLFTKPVRYICCYEKQDLIETLSRIEEILHQGYYLAGFISYEAGFCFEDIAPFTPDKQSPLLWFGVYEKPIICNHKDGCFYGSNDIGKLLAGYKARQNQACNVSDIKTNIEKDEYIHDVESVRDSIAKGDTYQINYTFKYKFDFDGSSEALFFNLCMKQSASYTAFIRCMGKDILSLSPELFFRREANRVMVKPMKGTIKRGINNADDIEKAAELHNSIKNRAENVMIVDLLRNDIGRISKMGSVEVTKLYEIEKYETLFQMTSTVESELRDEISWLNLFKSIFPCGSVTGAPKINTMRIINSLEKEPRGIYTGSIGYIAPNNNSVFNVAIRTVVLDRTMGQKVESRELSVESARTFNSLNSQLSTLNSKGEMGIGSGIVYDSEPSAEFDECLLKADFLTTKYIDFQLIETILWQDGKFFLLDLHFKRLMESAEYFGFDYDKSQIIQALADESRKFTAGKKYRVRLLLHKNGDFSISSSELEEINAKKVTFSDIRTNPEDRFLYHKTTNRKLYDDELKKARAEGYYDVLFLNNRDELTEGAISNIIIETKDKYYTPPIMSGLLNGVFRRHLFETGFPLEEKVLFKDDILRAEKIYMVNSVRGMLEVNL